MARRTGEVLVRPAAVAMPVLPSVAAAIADAERNSRRVVFIRIVSTLSRWRWRVKGKTDIQCGFAPIENGTCKTRLNWRGAYEFTANTSGAGASAAGVRGFIISRGSVFANHRPGFASHRGLLVIDGRTGRRSGDSGCRLL